MTNLEDEMDRVEADVDCPQESVECPEDDIDCSRRLRYDEEDESNPGGLKLWKRGQAFEQKKTEKLRRALQERENDMQATMKPAGMCKKVCLLGKSIVTCES